MEAQLVRPIADRVVLKMDKLLEETKSGIVLQRTGAVNEKPSKATVVFIGPGRTLENGVIKPMDVVVGDRVYVPKYGGDEVNVLGTTYRVISNDDIIAVLTGDAAKTDEEIEAKRLADEQVQ